MEDKVGKVFLDCCQWFIFGIKRQFGWILIWKKSLFWFQI